MKIDGLKDGEYYIFDNGVNNLLVVAYCKPMEAIRLELVEAYAIGDADSLRGYPWGVVLKHLTPASFAKTRLWRLLNE